jgi:hypothetical protein
MVPKKICCNIPLGSLHYKKSPKMQPINLQLHAINCHLQLTFIGFTTILHPLAILATMLQLHLQPMTSSSYTLILLSSMIMSICPISCKWYQT